MNAGIEIHALGPPHRDLLITMYDRFDPLGEALGLPPRSAEARREWIGVALDHKMNLAAFSPAGEVVGHCFLVADKPGSAELAIFVHQESRRRGVGRALLKTALQWGWAAELGRAWAVAGCDNRAALGLLISCGFRLRQSACAVAELDIDLPLPWAPREILRPLSFDRHGEDVPGCLIEPDSPRNSFFSGQEGAGISLDGQPAEARNQIGSTTDKE